MKHLVLRANRVHQINTERDGWPSEPFVSIADDVPCEVGYVWDGVAPHAPGSIGAKVALVDLSTDDGFAAGFTFRGQRVSLSLEAQMNAAGLMIALPYMQPSQFPIRWNNYDDSDVILLDGPADVVELFLTGFAAKGVLYEAGTTAKAAARAEVSP